MKRNAFLAAATAAMFNFVGPSMAQESNPQRDETALGNTLEEIVVTATRRTMRLQDVPVSITAYSQEQLDLKRIVNYQGLAFNTPGAILNRASANFNNFSVRGVATNGYNANLQSTVAIYIDELPISANGNSTILDPNLFDVERVEFLRGPQGTLFGSNSLAGAVRIINKNPDPTEFDSTVAVDFGMTDSDALRQRYDAMVNIPVLDNKAALRLVGFYRNEEGYVDNIGTGIDNSNTLIDYGGRAIFLWEPTEKSFARFMYMSEDSKPEDSSLVGPHLGDKVRLSDRPDRFQAFLDTYNLTLGYRFGGVELQSSSTWATFDQEFIVDLAGTFAQAFPFALDALAYDEIFVEEVQLVSDSGGKFEWVLGGYYNRKRRDVNYQYRSTPEYLAAQGITGLDDEYYSKFWSYFVTHEKAAFASLSYHASDSFWVTGGIRYTDSDVQGFYYSEPGAFTSNYLTLALFGLSGPVTITPYSRTVGPKVTERGPSYKFSVSYSPVSNMTAYASYANGFRTPSANARAGQASTLDPNDIVIPDGAESDNLDNFELGLKGTFWDGKVTANIAAYLIDWSNIQVQVNRVSDTAQFATNIGEARSQGLELEISANLTDDFMVGFNGSYNDSEVTDLTDEEAAVSGAVEGAQLSFPRLQGSLFLKYDFGVWAGREGSFTTNALFVDDYPNMFPFAPGQPGVPVPTYDENESYSVVNMTLGAELSENLTLNGYVENVFDNDSYNYVHPEAFIESRYGIPRPRTVGFRLVYEY